MTAAVDICNMALSQLRAGKINSLTEGSLQADQCNLFYETCLKQCLEDAPWGFATRVQALAVLDSTLYPVFNWVYAYQHPSDCLTIDRLILNFEEASQDSSVIAARLYDYGLPQPNLEKQVEHEILNIGGDLVIAANDSDLRIKYRIYVNDPNKFSSSFNLALSHLIAAHVAVSVCGEEKGSKLKRDSLSLYQSLINNAISHQLNQGHTPVPDSEFITVRS